MWADTLAQGKYIISQLKMIHTKEWKDILALEEIILVKCPYYPKKTINLMQSIPNTHDIFHRTRKHNSNIYMEPQKT